MNAHGSARESFGGDPLEIGALGATGGVEAVLKQTAANLSILHRETPSISDNRSFNVSKLTQLEIEQFENMDAALEK